MWRLESRVVFVGMAWAWAWASTTLTGCSEGDPERFRVRGVISFHDEPVPRGWVIFSSQNDAAKHTATKHTATISGDGQYQLELPAGEYRVGVSAPREMAETGIEAFKAATPPPYVPVQFADPEYSGVTATVKAIDENQIDFPLQMHRSGTRR